YGLAVQEALCSGVPVFVSAVAGIAERYPSDLRELLLPDAGDAAELANRLTRWQRDPQRFAPALARFASELRDRSWEQMARDIVELIDGNAPSEQPRAVAPAEQSFSRENQRPCPAPLSHRVP